MIDLRDLLSPAPAGMNVCVDTGRLDEAQRILDVMRAAGLSPGWASYHILMKYHARRGDMDAARRLFVQLRSYLGGRVPGGFEVTLGICGGRGVRGGKSWTWRPVARQLRSYLGGQGPRWVGSTAPAHGLACFCGRWGSGHNG